LIKKEGDGKRIMVMKTMKREQRISSYTYIYVQGGTKGISGISAFVVPKRDSINKLPRERFLSFFLERRGEGEKGQALLTWRVYENEPLRGAFLVPVKS